MLPFPFPTRILGPQIPEHPDEDAHFVGHCEPVQPPSFAVQPNDGKFNELHPSLRQSTAQHLFARSPALWSPQSWSA
jgi:hypothetical protein